MENLNNNLVYIRPDLWQTPEISEWAGAMAKFHTELQPISKDKILPFFKDRVKVGERPYLSLDGILATVRPLLAKNGLFVVQSISGDSICTTIYHSSGQYQGSAVSFAAMDGNTQTNNLQKMGGGLTYIKRYALSAALGISADDDDDGNTTSVTIEKKNSPRPTPKKVFTKVSYSKNKAGLVKMFAEGKTLDDVTAFILENFDVIDNAALKEMEREYNKLEAGAEIPPR